MDFIIFLMPLRKFDSYIGNLNKSPLDITLLYMHCIELQFGDDLVLIKGCFFELLF